MTEAEFILCEILVLRCQRGDKSAAAELVGLFKKPVLYYLWRLVGLEEEACFRFSEQSLLHASFCLSGIISAPRRHCSHFPFFWLLMALLPLWRYFCAPSAFLRSPHCALIAPLWPLK